MRLPCLAAAFTLFAAPVLADTDNADPTAEGFNGWVREDVYAEACIGATLYKVEAFNPLNATIEDEKPITSDNAADYETHTLVTMQIERRDGEALGEEVEVLCLFWNGTPETEESDLEEVLLGMFVIGLSVGGVSEDMDGFAVGEAYFSPRSNLTKWAMERVIKRANGTPPDFEIEPIDSSAD